MRSNSAIYTWAEELRKKMLEEYRVLQEAEYETAVTETNGVMLNRRGEARGVDSWAVFTSGPAVLEAYASEELRNHLARSPRTTRTEYERAWLDAFLDGGPV